MKRLREKRFFLTEPRSSEGHLGIQSSTFYSAVTARQGRGNKDCMRKERLAAISEMESPSSPLYIHHTRHIYKYIYTERQIGREKDWIDASFLTRSKFYRERLSSLENGVSYTQPS